MALEVWSEVQFCNNILLDALTIKTLKEAQTVLNANFRVENLTLGGGNINFNSDSITTIKDGASFIVRGNLEFTGEKAQKQNNKDYTTINKFGLFSYRDEQEDIVYLRNNGTYCVLGYGTETDGLGILIEHNYKRIRVLKTTGEGSSAQIEYIRLWDGNSSSTRLQNLLLKNYKNQQSDIGTALTNVESRLDSLGFSKGSIDNANFVTSSVGSYQGTVYKLGKIYYIDLARNINNEGHEAQELYIQLNTSKIPAPKQEIGTSGIFLVNNNYYTYSVKLNTTGKITFTNISSNISKEETIPYAGVMLAWETYE